MQQKIQQIIAELFDLDIDVVLSRPEPQFGDAATNVAMQLAKPLGKNPREIAEQIGEKLRDDEDSAEVSVAGPGFINIRLSDKALIGQVYAEPSRHYADQRLVFEYSCPNAFKELHTGHLYQTIFGDIAARLMVEGGANLQRTSFGGDVGLHVAKCLWGMRAILGGEEPERLSEISDDVFERARWISQCYVHGAKAYEESQSAKADIDELNVEIYGYHENGDYDSPLAKIYWQTRQWSFDYFDAFYEMLKVKPLFYYPESQTAPIGMSVVQEQLKQGNLKESDGAIVFEGDESKHLHTRVFVTSKGLPTYETKDIGVIWLERQDYDFDHRYLLTGNDQKEYMRVVFAAAETFSPDLQGRMTHLTNGTVRFGDGTKMSSRLGNVSRAADVVEAVREKVADLVADESLRETVALGAVKYAFARYRLGGDINFDLDETVSLQGNSGPYIQYAHARARSILGKSKVEASGLTELFDEDRALVRKMGEYHEALDVAIRQLEPHHICNYLFELAQEFNRYYEKNRVVGDEKEAHRLSLVLTYADILKAGLGLLGIEAPDKL